MPTPRPAPHRSPSPRRRRGERGIALLLVMIALLLLAVLSLEVAQTSATQARVGSNTMNEFLLRSAVDGRTQILRAALMYDYSLGAEIDTEDEEWSWFNHDEKLSSWGERSPSFNDQSGEESITFRNVDAELEAWCEDERSKVNLMGLARPAETPERKFTRETLIRLIDVYREDWSELDLTEADAVEMVDQLIEWLSEQADEEKNPTPDVAAGRGKLLSIDDLLRVPGGKWTQEVLYDVPDPNAELADEQDVDEDVGPRDLVATYQYREVVQRSEKGFASLFHERRHDPIHDRYEASDDEAVQEDARFRRPNGVPGLVNYLTVHADPVANPALRINVNTAPLAVMRALFEERDQDLADAIVEHRREGAGSEDDTTTGGTPTPADEEVGFFHNKGQLSRVEGMAESLDTYPRLNFFADVSSDIFSLRVVAKMKTGTIDRLE